MWAFERVFYQVYPLGFVGASYENDGSAPGEGKGIGRLAQWIGHLRDLGVGAVYFSPIFYSDSHGYNTRDFGLVDNRLGSNGEFAALVAKLHEADIKVVLDGVFNHVGRGFGPFLDVLRNRENSPYLDWFYRIDLGGQSAYGDGLWYEGWEGHYDLVKLNLRNPAVRAYLLSYVERWIEEFGIDGLRLDVAYSLEPDFLRELRALADAKYPDFFLLGEMIHGDYNRLVNASMLHSATNYECYKGLHSSFNSANLFEICHSLQRQFGPEPWCLYTGKHLLSFADNHDVARLASVLQNPKHLPLAYAMLFGMPGIPCIYYGSEWGIEGQKGNMDRDLRPYIAQPQGGPLAEAVGRMAKARAASKALQYGGYRQVLLTNKQCIFERRIEGERVLVAVNMDQEPYTAHFDAGCGLAQDLISGEQHDFGGGSLLPPYSAFFWKMER